MRRVCCSKLMKWQRTQKIWRIYSHSFFSYHNNLGFYPQSPQLWNVDLYYSIRHLQLIMTMHIECNKQKHDTTVFFQRKRIIIANKCRKSWSSGRCSLGLSNKEHVIKRVMGFLPFDVMKQVCNWNNYSNPLLHCIICFNAKMSKAYICAKEWMVNRQLLKCFITRWYNKHLSIRW